MRVIGGRFKSRRLRFMKAGPTRSTKDRVKETLFNMLPPLGEKERALDFFAGSGSLGIEAISRGVGHCDFIELDPEAFTLLEENVASLGIEDECHLIDAAAEDAIHALPKPYDFIILDPPYGERLVDWALKALEEKGLIAADALVAILSGKNEEFAVPPALSVKKTREVGVTLITILERSG